MVIKYCAFSWYHSLLFMWAESSLSAPAEWVMIGALLPMWGCCCWYRDPLSPNPPRFDLSSDLTWLIIFSHHNYTWNESAMNKLSWVHSAVNNSEVSWWIRWIHMIGLNYRCDPFALEFLQDPPLLTVAKQSSSDCNVERSVFALMFLMDMSLIF